MYRIGGSSQVELSVGGWEDTPVQNMQLQFNTAHYTVPVLIEAPQEEEQDATQAARERAAMHETRVAIKAATLALFDRSTKQRLARWRQEHQVEVERPREKSRENVPWRPPSPSRKALDLSDLSLGASTRSDSRKARKQILRFTHGRRSFRITSVAQSPMRRLAPGVSAEQGSEDDVGNKLPRAPPVVPRVEQSTPASEVKEAELACSTFVGPQTFKLRQGMAQHQAQVRRKESAFGRLLARRQRALHDHEQQELARQIREKRDKEEEQAENAMKAPPISVEDKERLAKEEAAANKHKESVSKRREKDESIRYISALQHRLEQMLHNKSGVRLPALCSCQQQKQPTQPRNISAIFSPSPFDKGSPAAPSSGAPWEHCANNCRFYKNPQVYAKELADLFRSLEL